MIVSAPSVALTSWNTNLGDCMWQWDYSYKLELWSHRFPLVFDPQSCRSSRCGFIGRSILHASKSTLPNHWVRRKCHNITWWNIVTLLIYKALTTCHATPVNAGWIVTCMLLEDIVHLNPTLPDQYHQIISIHVCTTTSTNDVRKPN